MPRYIDADALTENLLSYADANKGTYHAEGFKNAITVVEDQPTADVVEIVHCKDCSWCQLKRIRSNKNDSYFECILWGNPTTPEFYCAAGERRE